MKFVVIAAIILSSISLAGCLGTPTYGSVGRVPDSPIAKRPPLEDCVHLPFPQCSGA
jgi:hypothetical protein